MRCVIFLALVVAVTSQILPNVCNKQSHSCVGENQQCTADLTKGCPSSATSSVCRRCNSVDLVCHEGVCLAALGTEGDKCEVSEHEFCRSGYQCSNPNSAAGRCLKGRLQPQEYKHFGESCYEPAECFGQLTCDGASKVCTLPETQIGSREYDCDTGGSDFDDHDSCPFGYFCQDRGANKVCTKSLPLSKRLGYACEDDRECGHKYECVPKNPLESNPVFMKKICMPRFQAAEGHPCSSNDQCGKGMLCSGNTCSKPNRQFKGNGCTSNNECGRLMVCGCPPGASGRSRCMETNTLRSHDNDVDEYKARLPYLACLEANECQAGSDIDSQYDMARAELSCAWTHCRTKMPTQPEPKCRAPNYDDYYVAYTGLMNGATRSAPVAVFGCIVAALALLL